MNAAAMRRLDWDPPRFLLRGLSLTTNNPSCRGFTKDQLLELRAERERVDDQPPAGQHTQADRGNDAASIVDGDEHAQAAAQTAEAEPLAGPPPLSVGAQFGLELKRMMAERKFAPPAFSPLPLAAPAAAPILVRGIATKVEIDMVRTLVAHSALAWDPAKLPPLLHKHGEPAGEILALRYSPLGDELRVEARIDHPEARRMPAFSVAFVPEVYQLVDRRGFWHFRVTKGRLVEISLTDIPALRSALIEARAPAAATIEDPRFKAIANKISLIKLALAA